jgi:hypothetical protein
MLPRYKVVSSWEKRHMCETCALIDRFSKNLFFFFYEIRVPKFMWSKFVTLHHANIKGGGFRDVPSPSIVPVCSLFQVMNPQTNFD